MLRLGERLRRVDVTRADVSEAQAIVSALPSYTAKLTKFKGRVSVLPAPRVVRRSNADAD